MIFARMCDEKILIAYDTYCDKKGTICDKSFVANVSFPCSAEIYCCQRVGFRLDFVRPNPDLILKTQNEI